ncbi:hypothetical protein F7725_007814 [Dissostichus mawsoni]|uniref:Uncharacterized protein n=1 Tax=Dissostichus mawsoni TaxID=36200 RepID=A0A7J5Y6I1_DISMA|nr:hypothetical protein F7725_007814 [Dissostichus mawsoni]
MTALIGRDKHEGKSLFCSLIDLWEAGGEETPAPDSTRPTRTGTQTHTPYHCGSAVLCCGRLKWPLWAELNISVRSGRASECRLPPAASAPGTGCQPTRRPTSLNPCQAPDATLGGPASCGSGMALLKSSPPPPHPPLLSGSFGSRKQPRCVPNVELH